MDSRSYLTPHRCIHVSSFDFYAQFFAIINVVSGFLQFAVLPQVMQLIEPSTLWRIVPAIVLTFASNMSFNKDPSLYLIAGTFLTMKALEFSARRMLDEMVYVPLDYDAVSFWLLLRSSFSQKCYLRLFLTFHI